MPNPTPTGVKSASTLLQRGDGGGTEVFTTVAFVKDFDFPKLSRDAIETTSHSSGGVEEAAPSGILKSGDVSFEIVYDAANVTHDAAVGLHADLITATLHNWKIVLTNGKTWKFAGFITKFEPKAPVHGVYTAGCSIKVTGAVTVV
jgi:hypothetical protein